MTPRKAPPFWLLVMLAAGATLPMHMFVPALPDAARLLHASDGDMQQAISVYIAGLAAGQLVYGPLADAFGRRPALVAGLAIYALGSLVVALAPDLSFVLVGRFVQALGACAGLALGRAIVRDVWGPEGAMSGLALLNITMVLSPGVAPMIGGAVAGAWGWRWMFLGLCAFASLTLLLNWCLLPETAQPTGSVNVSRMADDYRTLLRSRTFMGFAMGNGFATFSIHALLGAAPFILVEDLRQPVERVGLFMGLMISGLVFGNAATARLARRVSSIRLLRAGGLISFASAAALLACRLLGSLDLTTLVIGVMALTCGIGVVNPVALAGALRVDDRVVGSAVGLSGFLQMSIGAACAAVSALTASPAISSLSILLVATLISQLAFSAAHARSR